MPDFQAIAVRLFPGGTNLGSTSRDLPPDWPPDLFAFASVVVESFGIYAEEEFTAGWDIANYHFGPAFQARVQRECAQWTGNGIASRSIAEIWKRLFRSRKGVTGVGWRRDVVFLMILADEASRGAGFEIRSGSGGFVAQLVFEELAKLQDRKPVLLPHLPNSLCLMVPAEEVCVQPKTNTPQVGCTLRSMSHHLCLLPSTGVVKTSWTYAAPAKTPTQHFNVLAVPFPYKLEGSDFRPMNNPSDEKNSFFCVRQGWLSRRNRAASATGISQFILALVEAAEREAETVHAIVLPELALPGATIEDVVRKVAREKPRLELFVAGILDELPKGRYRNCAFTAVLIEGQISQYWRQPKHHRWRLEESQIARYDLGFVLEPERNWWEAIDVSGRSCAFTVVRPSTSIATLICEDLARFDPLMPVIDSVGSGQFLYRTQQNSGGLTYDSLCRSLTCSPRRRNEILMAQEKTSYPVRSSKLKREMQEVLGRSESSGGYRTFVKRFSESGRFAESRSDPLPPKSGKKVGKGNASRRK